MSTRTMLCPTAPSTSGLLNFKIQDMFSKIHLERTCLSTITADQNIEAIERIVMRDRQISVRRLELMNRLFQKQ